ncbi:fatty acid desaturase [Rhizobium ruizarguesonis]|uniref:fatty acid desaturase n=1 Tax=Rhizobium ruizarguesonis TaxID=2081791 RepID=UPI0013E0D466|nr:fatty acid desaturase [Rhizobium ruizarguesonis]NEI79067.1 fatty acid desaturase [Rhizobium ruizarguesonis]
MSDLVISYKCRNRISALQVGWTIALYFMLWWIALALADHMYPVSLVLALALGFCTVRIFNIQHDCTHHSYFTSNAANDYLGLFLGVLTLTPHFYWTVNHLRHHGTSGNLDLRGFGDIHTYTLREFQQLSTARKTFYILYRNPFIYLLIGPIYHFALKMRVPYIARRRSRARFSIHLVNGMLALICLEILLYFPDPKIFFTLYAVNFITSGAIGLGLFYVQHQFEGAYWQRTPDWKFSDASLHGSSYLRLPRFLEWFFVYINIHHVHHLHPKTPNYHLKSRAVDLPVMSQNVEITLLDSIRSFRLKLWDEDAQKMVGFPVKNRSPQHDDNS